MSVDTEQEFLALCPRGVGSLLTHELSALGASDVRETPAGVFFSGGRATLYRACLWSRLASRVLLPLAEVDAADADALSRGLKAIAWPRLFAASSSGAGRRSGLACSFSRAAPGRRSTCVAAACTSAVIVSARGRRH